MSANVNQPDWDVEVTAPFSARLARVGAHAGAERLGAGLYELGAGASVSPMHIHHANEELLVVLEGTPSVRTPDGVHELATGDVISFPVGPDGAHQLLNGDGAPTARVLVVSTMVYPDVVEHPDSDKVIAQQGPAEGLAFRRSDAVAPLEGEPVQPEIRFLG